MLLGQAVTSVHLSVLLSTLTIKPSTNSRPFESMLAVRTQGLRAGWKGSGKSVMPKITKARSSNIGLYRYVSSEKNHCFRGGQIGGRARRLEGLLFFISFKEISDFLSQQDV